MVQKPIGLRLDEGLLARLDEARGDVPRARWIARAIEDGLERCERGESTGRAARGMADIGLPAARSARSSVQAKRDVRPIPKGRS